jgi:hypothetical protein
MCELGIGLGPRHGPVNCFIHICMQNTRKKEENNNNDKGSIKWESFYDIFFSFWNVIIRNKYYKLFVSSAKKSLFSVLIFSLSPNVLFWSQCVLAKTKTNKCFAVKLLRCSLFLVRFLFCKNISYLCTYVSSSECEAWMLWESSFTCIKIP